MEEKITAQEVKGHRQLVDEVIKTGLCTYCGACTGSCPYLVAHNGKVIVLDNCNRDEGQCYQFCPRTYTDMEAVSRNVFDAEFSENAFGAYNKIYLARTKVPEFEGIGQDGSVVTTLLSLAIQSGMIDAAVVSKMDDDRMPDGYVARSREELLECARTSYEPCPTLQALNKLPEESTEKVGVVGLPCHTEALAKMKTYGTRNRFNIDNVKLVIGLFCGWTLSHGVHEFMREQWGDLSNIVKFDIPHHPAHTFDAYYGDGVKKEIEIEDIRKYITNGCNFCWDMTAEFADLSVGSGRAKYRGWNTLIVRTTAGARLVETAIEKNVLETQSLPEDNLISLKRAAINKKRKAIHALRDKYDGGLGYIGLSEEKLKKIEMD